MAVAVERERTGLGPVQVSRIEHGRREIRLTTFVRLLRALDASPADLLRWRNHLRRGVSMTNSAMRRNVAQHLGISSAADIKSRRYIPTPDDALRVSEWIRECDITWIECETEPEAVALETALKAEFKPPLTKL